ncbi:hypothetical protein IB260_09820 [Pseudomonas sp. PDM23]|uniref:hypothetical protein n=1 Tax=unclassified Pseudomonas TaxID=196821 RepID=UPI0017832989|nr:MULTISPECIES: hypothetical protein [unclassified Pseudomonas]MBD9575602.1 hypothetical protein [Pseudomonas sp. PDM23]MBD9669456.1 hypothetical protein [Pseudomonas sp. PDM21]
MNWLSKSGFSRYLVLCLAIAFVCLLNNAVPGLLTPTLGQAVWTTGFAQSLANHGLGSLYAQDIGVPSSAAIAFGLAGAWPVNILLRLGLQPADAYSMMVALWLIVAFLAARQIALRLGCTPNLATLGAVVWATQPVIWAHAGYSMLSLGIALLPFYFWSLMRLLDTTVKPLAGAAGYLVAAFIAVFMDGYTFVMFAVGSSLALCYALVFQVLPRARVLFWAMPVHLAGFALAYWSYTRYVGVAEFSKSPLEFFRGWGLDLSYLVAPSRGVLWIPDLLGLSEYRSAERFYGDVSTWQTTFALPLLLAAGVATALSRRRRALTVTLIGALLLAYYLALGPSLKVHSIKPQGVPDQRAETLAPLMPAERALAPTGTAWVWEHLPGFNSMRAVYRWAALGVFAAWLLLMLHAPDMHRRRLGWVLLGSLTLLNLPHMIAHWRWGEDSRSMFALMDGQMVEPLGKQLYPGELVAFVPWGNDFMANYMASRLKVRTFNIGGDKNLEKAYQRWPPAFQAMGAGAPAALDVESLTRLLLTKDADALVFPYIDMLWAVRVWPCLEQTSMRLAVEQRADLELAPHFSCPADIRQQRHDLVQRLAQSPWLQVEDGEWFATVRLKSPAQMQQALGQWAEKIQFPIVIRQGFSELDSVLAAGWYPVESGHVWSGSKARLQLPIPRGCQDRLCEFQLTLGAFAASADRHVGVSLRQSCRGIDWSESHQSVTPDPRIYSVPVCTEGSVQSVWVEVDKPESPQRLYGSQDVRVLGVSLTRIELHEVK